MPNQDLHSQQQSERLRSLEVELNRDLEGETRFDDWMRMLYSTDASIYQIMPLGVIFPKSEEDVEATIKHCLGHGVPVLPRGGGSSLAGQTVGEAVVLDFTRHMSGPVRFSREQRRVTCGPGISLSRLNRQIAGSNLMYGPDPASADRATVGGIVGNNSTGAHSILYGMTSDHLHRLRVVLADGSRAVFEDIEWEEARRRAGLSGNGGSPGLEGRIYGEVVSIAESAAEAISEAFPRTWRRVGGYNLPALEAGRPLNLARLIAGSEGTLCTVVEAELNLVQRPPGTSLAVFSFETLLDSLATVPALLAEEPSAVELLDSMLIELCRASPEYGRRMTFIEGSPEAALVVEVYGETEAAHADQLERLRAAVHRSAEGAVGIRLISDSSEQANVWEVRKAALGLLMSKRGDYKPIPFIEDTAVSPDHLRDYIADVQEVLSDLGAPAAFYAHASAGCLHIRPLINLKETSEIVKMAAISDAVSDLVLRYGGAMSGEHGDGLARSALNPRIHGEPVHRLFEQIKDAFDPGGLMNPGKIVRAPAMTESLRFGDAYATGDTTSHFDFTADGGFARAVEMCNGAGACRKEGSGTMCPSYMATREEEHSTRGRANALRMVLSDQLVANGLGDRRLFETLDLCLECKACRSECPSGVDMTRLKAEFLAHYHEQNGIPFRARLFGGIASVSRIGSAVAPVSNWLMESRPARSLLERGAGVDRRRTLPAFQRKSFRRRYGARKSSHSADQAPAVDADTSIWLLPDTFTNYNEPHVGMAAVELLEAAGVTVRILPIPAGCCGRPHLSRGLVPRAKRMAARNVNRWSKLVADGTPILGLEPSCLLTLRDEYPALVRGDAALSVADSAFLIEEWLDGPGAAAAERLVFRDPSGQDESHLMLHGHCHQKALAGTGSLQRLLSRLPGTRTEEVDSGCCGLAGSFGYEKEHYELSMAVGGQRLFPAVEALTGGGTVVAAGTSCRHQIRDGTGRHALHPVEVMAKRLDR
jgi:FAD/FMN-containing dehydrogenase/Fe-S oxidoreductase